MTEKEMCIEIAYRDFKIEHESVFKNLNKIQFPESVIKFIFTEGYKAKDEDIKRQKNIEKQILETLKKQFV